MSDLIDREELRRKIYERFGKHSTKVIATFEEGRVMTDWAFLEPFLNAMPTIEPEVRHGQWVVDCNGIIVCNQCSYPRQIGAKDFCGKCGARMDGGAENG